MSKRKTYGEIGAFLNRDHTTIMHGITRYLTHWAAADPAFAAIGNEIKALLKDEAA